MKKRNVGILKWSGIVIIAVTLVYLMVLGAAGLSLKRAYEALEADGRPLKREDVIPTSIPSPDNAALVYESVVLKLRAERAGETNLWRSLGKAAEGVISESPDADDIERFRGLFVRPAATDAMADVEAGSRRPGYWNDLEYSRGLAMEFPHLEDLLSLTRIICAGARLKTAAGEPAAAWESSVTALRVANALKDEPILISQLVRLAQIQIATESIQGLPYSADSHKEAEALLKAFEDPAPLVAAIDGERIHFGESVFQDWGGGKVGERVSLIGSLTDSEAGLFGVVYPVFRPLHLWDRAAYSRMMHAHAQTMSDPNYSADPEVDRGFSAKAPWYCVITRLMLPAIDQVRDRLADEVARARVTRAGLAVLQLHAEQGAWPDALPVQADLSDPFTGTPLIYQPSPNGFTLYSVGKDRVDDMRTKSEKGKDDIVWRYPTGAAAEAAK